jgi:hypothetical protein
LQVAKPWVWNMLQRTCSRHPAALAVMQQHAQQQQLPDEVPDLPQGEQQA